MKELRLFLVARWGNEREGANGCDTLFVVRCSEFRRAAYMVDVELRKLPERRVLPSANWVCEIGCDGSSSSEEAILYGPIYPTTKCFPVADDYQNVWTREANDKEWLSRREEILAAKLKRV